MTGANGDCVYRYVSSTPRRVLLRPTVLSRAGEPLPTPLGTLDAIHLATALIWRERMGALPTMATHDGALGVAARTFGFDVRGI